MTSYEKRMIFKLGIAAAVFYNSWILALLLNRAYFGRQTSDLQNAGQPYDWLFILSDVIAGGIVILITLLLLKKVYELPKKWLDINLAGFSMFGVLTALSALVLQNSKLESLRFHRHIHRVSGFHDLIGGLAAFSLFISMLAVFIILFQQKQAAYKRFMYAVATLTLTWAVSGVVFFTIPQDSLPAIILQRIFIFSSSIWVYLMPQILIKFAKRSINN